jgi:hypothetical protein
MGRSNGISGFLSLLRAGSAATAFGAAILSCSDSATAPSALSTRDPALDGVKVVVVHIPDSLKFSRLLAGGNKVPGATSFSHGVTVAANVSVAPSTAAASVSAAPSAYTVSTVPFTPEPSPSNVLISTQPGNPAIDCGECVAFHVPIGFPFTFYGNTYSEIQVSSNGLTGFGSALGTEALPQDGCCSGWGIPSNDPNAMYNNIIALAWTDWTPSASTPVTVETQGTAPNRKFVLQWNNVPEYIPGTGRLTAQLVLSEGSSDITMYTTSMNVTNQWHMVTQGIQNATGSEAEYLPPVNAADPGRVQTQFSLSNDAIRFRINRNPITITAPPNLQLGTNAGVCFATVALTQPTVAGGGAGLVVAGQRNDKLALNADYPKGVTTITWTATDAAGTTEFATQTVTVADHEPPHITLPPNVVVPNDPGLATAVVNVGVAQVDDNCPNFSISSPANGVYPVGTTSVVWTATDAAGNTSTATQLVTVKDVEAPTISLPASGLTVNATSPAGAVVSFASYAHDNVGVASFSCTRVSGTTFPIGRTTVSCSAVDAAGNSSAPATISVTVLGAAQQLVNLMESIKGLLPIGAGESDDHGGNVDRGNNVDHGDNSDHRGDPRSGPHGDQVFSALSSGLGNSRSTRGACPALNVIAALVRAKTSAVIPAAKSAQILADVARIKNVIPCR